MARRVRRGVYKFGALPTENMRARKFEMGNGGLLRERQVTDSGQITVPPPTTTPDPVTSSTPVVPPSSTPPVTSTPVASSTPPPNTPSSTPTTPSSTPPPVQPSSSTPSPPTQPLSQSLSSVSSISSATSSIVPVTSVVTVTSGNQVVTMTSVGTSLAPPPTSSPNNSSSSTSSTKGWIIGGSVVGGVLVLTAIAYLLWFFLRRRFTDDTDDDAIKWPELVRHGSSGGTTFSELNPMKATRKEGVAGIGDDDMDDDTVRSSVAMAGIGRGGVSGSSIGHRTGSAGHQGAYYDDPRQAYYDPYMGPQQQQPYIYAPDPSNAGSSPYGYPSTSPTGGIRSTTAIPSQVYDPFASSNPYLHDQPLPLHAGGDMPGVGDVPMDQLDRDGRSGGGLERNVTVSTAKTSGADADETGTYVAPLEERTGRGGFTIANM